MRCQSAGHGPRYAMPGACLHAGGQSRGFASSLRMRCQLRREVTQECEALTTMAYDFKYGRITTERGSIGEDEPVFLLRARDDVALETIRHYLDLCEDAGAPVKHLRLIDEHAISDFEKWRQDNRTFIPTSEWVVEP